MRVYVYNPAPDVASVLPNFGVPDAQRVTLTDMRIASV